MKKAIYKVPNGKLLKIFLDDNEGKIISMSITGDFFMYPEENIELLEKALIGAPIKEESLTACMTDFFEKHPTSLFGLTPEALCTTILSAT